MTKPSDFFIGVVDFFAVLLPGAASVYLLQPLMISHIPTAWLPSTSTQNWVVFLVVAYITGHLLHAIGSCLLDKFVYEKLYLPKLRPSHAKAAKLTRDPYALREDKNAAETLLARVRLTTKVNPTGTNYYDWCLSDIRVSSPAGAIEVDRLQADSKFFRSMVFVFLIVMSVGLREGSTWIPIGAAALIIFAILRFCDLRWTATKRVYEYYLLRDPQTQASESAGSTA